MELSPVARSKVQEQAGTYVPEKSYGPNPQEEFKTPTTLSPEQENLTNKFVPGIATIKDYYEDPEKLKLLRMGRIAATSGAVVLNFWAVLGLFYAAGKLALSVFGMADKDEAFNLLGKGYTKSSIAGGLTGLAHESPYWSIGNLGMGLFSYLGLDKIHWLAGFSIADGIASIGMGQVRDRDSQNAFAVQHSIFNHPNFSSLKFLMPVEQAVINFAKNISSPKSWKRLVVDEPYALFQKAGGGLIAAGGLLGVGSMFAEKMSESVRSLAYIPYSAFSLLNLIALFRDGKVVAERADDFGGRIKAEDYSMRSEGYFKQLASPVLGVNNFLLALKGLGLDSQNGFLYPLAMAVRACGAAFAFLGFTAQSGLKFFKPDSFGPFKKRVMEVILNPKEAWKSIYEFLQSTSPKPHKSDKFDKIIEEDQDGKLFMQITATPTFQKMKEKSQAGFPSPLFPNRGDLERFTHSKRVCTLAILFDQVMKKNIINNPSTPESIKTFYLENRLALKVAMLVHDAGHIARSHLGEESIRGLNNDEETMKLLKDTNSDICQAIITDFVERYGEVDGNRKAKELLEKVKDILGHKTPLRWKIFDFLEYAKSNGGDFNSTDPNDFPAWSLDDYSEFFESITFVEDEYGRPLQIFKPDGAVKAFSMLYDRYKFNLRYNYDPLLKAQKIVYLLGADAANISLEEARKLTEREFDGRVKIGLESINGDEYTFVIRILFGGENAYCGYSAKNPRTRIMVLLEDGRKMEFLEYRERVMKYQDPKQYEETQEEVNKLTIPFETELRVKVRNRRFESAEVKAAA